METRRTSGLVVLGFLSSLLVYSSFIASAIMTTIVTVVDRDRTMYSVTGISPNDLRDLVFALQITSTAGLALAGLSALLSLGGCATVFSDRLRKKGLSLAAVALGLSFVAAAGHAFTLFKNPMTKLDQAVAPFQMTLTGEEGQRRGTWDFVLTLQAPEGDLLAARKYKFTLIAESSWGEWCDLADLTPLVHGAVREGMQSVQVSHPGVRFKETGSYSVVVRARQIGVKPSILREVASTYEHLYISKSSDR